jgi:hypothetical protein
MFGGDGKIYGFRQFLCGDYHSLAGGIVIVKPNMNPGRKIFFYFFPLIPEFAT